MMVEKRNVKALIEAIKILRTAAPDDKAILAVAAYPNWMAGTAYTTEDRVMFEGVLYRVLMNHTSQEEWTPNAAPSLFAKVLIPDVNEIYAWEQPDSTNPYMTGDKVSHNGKIWVSNCDNNTWEPGVYGWDEVVTEPEVEEPVVDTIPIWSQPDSSNPYMIGAKVSHKDQIWTSTVDGNVWEPGVYGWEVVE